MILKFKLSTHAKLDFSHNYKYFEVDFKFYVKYYNLFCSIFLLKISNLEKPPNSIKNI